MSGPVFEFTSRQQCGACLAFTYVHSARSNFRRSPRYAAQRERAVDLMQSAGVNDHNHIKPGNPAEDVRNGRPSPKP